MKNVIMVILVAAVGYFGFTQWKASQDSKAPTAIDKVKDRKKTEVIEKRDIKFTVRVAGEISPADKVSVRPEVHGKIAELPVDISDKVAKGELLFRLDDKDLQIEIATRKKQIDSANLQLDQAKNEFDRSAQLFKDDLISKEAYENTKTRYELSQNSRDRAQNDYDLSLEKLSKTSVVAPFDCTVLTRPVSIGQAVSGSGGSSGGTEVMEIADLNNLIIEAHVNQSDVQRMNKSQKVSIEIEAIKGLMVEGIVERIAPQATIRNSIKGFATRIKLLTSSSEIIPGMTASINIPVASAEDTVAAPLAAIFTERNEEEQRTETYVYVKSGDKFNKHLVDVGVSDLRYGEIKAGLQGGEEISLEQPAEELIGETISISGQTVAAVTKELDPEDAKYDKDGDGKLSRDERREKMRDAFKNMSPEDIQKLRERAQKFRESGGGSRGGRGGGGPRGGGRN